MEAGMSVAAIAKEYGVTRQAVYKRIQDEEKKKRSRDAAGYGMDAIESVDNGNYLIDPETGMTVRKNKTNAQIIARIGDEKVTAFVTYHMEMMAMRQGVNKRDVNDLYQRFYNYLAYCQEHGIVPNNMNAYFAIGVTRQEMWHWKNGDKGTPEHREFAEMVTGLFASIHEQGATDGVLNHISAMFWQKAHDGLIEASKVEVQNTDPLGDRRSAADIQKAYQEVELPE